MVDKIDRVGTVVPIADNGFSSTVSKAKLIAAISYALQ